MLLFRINKYPAMCFIYISSIDMLKRNTQKMLARKQKRVCCSDSEKSWNERSAGKRERERRRDADEKQHKSIYFNQFVKHLYCCFAIWIGCFMCFSLAYAASLTSSRFTFIINCETLSGIFFDKRICFTSILIESRYINTFR